MKKIGLNVFIKKVNKKNLALIINSVFCGECGNTTIIDYENTILKCKCAKCGREVARYIETGEVRRKE